MDASESKPKIYVTAFLCESVLKELLPSGDLALSAIHITDAFTVAPTALKIPVADGAVMNVTVFPMATVTMLVLMYGEPRKFDVTIRGTKPGGSLAPIAHTFQCETSSEVSKNSSALNIKFSIPGEQAGAFWFEIYIDDVLEFKLPLLIRHASPPDVPAENPANLGSKPETDHSR